MRNRIQPLALFVGALLCFGNGSSLFAGMISRADIIASRSPASVPAHLVAPNVTRITAGDPAQASVPEERPLQTFAKQASAAGESSAHLAGGFYTAVLSLSSAVPFNGLLGAPGSTPHAPPPPGPDGGGNAGGMGMVSSNGGRDLPDALLAWSSAPLQEQTSVLAFQSFRAYPDPGSTGLFRPPRQR